MKVSSWKVLRKLPEEPLFARVLDTFKIGDVIVHRVKVIRGVLRVGKVHTPKIRGIK